MSDGPRDNPDETPKPTPAKPKRVMPIGHRFVKGQPPPPGAGRPKGIAKQIREATNNFEEQVARLVSIARAGKDRDAMEAIKILMDRGLGKAVDTVLTGELGAEASRSLLEDLTGAELAELFERIKRAS